MSVDLKELEQMIASERDLQERIKNVRRNKQSFVQAHLQELVERKIVRVSINEEGLAIAMGKQYQGKIKHIGMR